MKKYFNNLIANLPHWRMRYPTAPEPHAGCVLLCEINEQNHLNYAQTKLEKSEGITEEL